MVPASDSMPLPTDPTALSAFCAALWAAEEATSFAFSVREAPGVPAPDCLVLLVVSAIVFLLVSRAGPQILGKTAGPTIGPTASIPSATLTPRSQSTREKSRKICAKPSKVGFGKAVRNGPSIAGLLTCFDEQTEIRSDG